MLFSDGGTEWPEEIFKKLVIAKKLSLYFKEILIGAIQWLKTDSQAVNKDKTNLPSEVSVNIAANIYGTDMSGP